MSKRSYGKERGGQHVFQSLSPVPFSLPPLFLLKSVLFPPIHSLLLSVFIVPHSLFPSLCPAIIILSPPPISSVFSSPVFILTSLPPCVVMCNVLKLARSKAECCRYRQISHKSGCSDQLPHRGQRDIKTDMRGG